MNKIATKQYLQAKINITLNRQNLKVNKHCSQYYKFAVNIDAENSKDHQRR